MSNFLDYDKIEEYLEEHVNSIPPFLLELEHETHLKLLKSRMISGKAQGRFLSFISQLISPKKILEIGTFSGYAAFCLAEGLNENGSLDTIEVNDELRALHEKYLPKSKQATQITFHYGDAKSVIPTLNSKFDLIFLDADKKSYPAYLEMLVPMLNTNGILLADNVLWYDRVIDSSINDPETNAIREFNKLTTNHPKLKSFILPVRDGLTIAQKKEA